MIVDILKFIVREGVISNSQLCMLCTSQILNKHKSDINKSDINKSDINNMWDILRKSA